MFPSRFESKITNLRCRSVAKACLVVYMPTGCEIADSQRVACLSDPRFKDPGWGPLYRPRDDSWQVLESGWTRLVAADSTHYNIDVSKGLFLRQATFAREVTGPAYDEATMKPAWLRRITSSIVPTSHQVTATIVVICDIGVDPAQCALELPFEKIA
ncbi:hypothetical protein C8J57DRAFT_1246327 [Mycena rebaudengoi]|nr:hypothetical protein C8J57DRAFT_1246327 [Mycena rebaudengoi]